MISAAVSTPDVAIWARLALGSARERAFAHEGRKHVLSKSYRNTPPVSQLLVGMLWRRVSSLDPLPNIRGGAGVRVEIWGLSLKQQFFLWRGLCLL